MTVICFVVAFTALAQTGSPHQFGSSSNSGYLPQRVYDSGEKRFSDFEAMLAELARADVVFVGEQHDDPATHRLERAILEGMLRRKIAVTVSLEMFERDVQQSLNDYLAGKMNEESFLKGSRPWPRYATDYRPLVEIARAHNWPVIASNIPRRLASLISRQGLDSINSMPEADRKFVAAQYQCPFDDYFKRFNEAMSEHPAGDPKAGEKKEEKKDEKKVAEERAMVEKFYYSQCMKDETMAEAIVAASATSPNSAAKNVTVHYNGAFHSDYKLGTAARVIRRMPKAKIKVVSIVPVDNLDSINANEYRKRGDYVIFCLKTITVKAEPAR
ncbi:MAG: ChaN family lipoprotein [Acidobacteria bacterium]|nr:ChaN family lipoprotein [Acidobacteriota bacterium]